MLTITHHGAITGVTGSCHELTLHGPGGAKAGMLVDCGIFQGTEAAGRSGADELAVDFPIAHLRALVVTHVHIDHVGRIPQLLAAGFDGPILCSPPSALMLPEILEDALKIGFTRDARLIERVLDRIRARIVPVPFGQWHTVFNDGAGRLAIRLQRAGHILGSAYVECDATTAAEHQRIVFSGDLGAPDSPLLPEPRPPERADRLVIEATYGDRDHEDRATRRHRLQAVLEHALADGGTVLIPAFAIGRTQELLYEIEDIIFEAGDDPRWKELDIVVDSPLAAEFTRLYRKLKPYWDEEATARVREGRHPLSFDQLLVLDRHEDHLKAVDYLTRTGRAAVVIAGSGMCAGGRVVNYLKAMLGDARNDVLFVGYQAAGTPGRDILTFGPRGGWVMLDGERHPIRAQIHQVGGYSAHAGQSDLLRFVTGIPQMPAEIRIVHGDDEAKAALRRKLEAAGAGNVLIPDATAGEMPKVSPSHQGFTK
ncbi:MBL fold metallo-hydrolase [Aromatoleum bremense]|uniref:MBL fold metallo-hydrolase n=1 Tax=Aromatoleum bremense TaxID=76115 RepID=A0ABX1NYS4_9RHOO|nr:MBL fold metallo-hydrolase [Aromatoleum bremense]NMG16655.1 MBL fold metallo-hydrolase [Aromatoleum bremense]QTQ33511.1 Metallo-beta-lactamase domain-containing protein [Aromatoleum bremense]